MAVLADNDRMRREFTANIAHELKTPLTAISGYAELIANGMVEGEDDLRNLAVASIVRQAAWQRSSTTSLRCLTWTRPSVQLRARRCPLGPRLSLIHI